MTSLDVLALRIREGLLARVFDETEEPEQFMEIRDAQPFDSAWVRASEQLEEVSSSLSPSDEQRVTAIREAAFKEVYRLTENPDLAAYVSDDFGLIASALIRRVENPWINALWLSYTNRTFPRGELPLIAGSLEELVLRA